MKIITTDYGIRIYPLNVHVFVDKQRTTTVCLPRTCLRGVVSPLDTQYFSVTKGSFNTMIPWLVSKLKKIGYRNLSGLWKWVLAKDPNFQIF